MLHGCPPPILTVFFYMNPSLYDIGRIPKQCHFLLSQFYNYTYQQKLDQTIQLSFCVSKKVRPLQIFFPHKLRFNWIKMQRCSACTECSYNKNVKMSAYGSSKHTVLSPTSPSLASHTLCRERKGLVTLQLLSCHHNRNLLWQMRPVLFVDCIRCHGVAIMSRHV